MALWGITDADESKPKWAVRGGAVDPANIFATAEGWTLRHYKNAAKTEFWDEVLVAVDGLVGSGGRGTDTIAEADITAVFFGEESVAQGETGRTVVVIYNELVDVTVGATLVVTGSVTGAITATYASGTGTNRVVFEYDVPAQTETLSIGAQTITGTIEDAGTSTASDKVIAAEDVTGAGGFGTDLTLSVA